MRYPTLNSKGTYKTSVPELNGGINVSKSMTEIEDNQLTDCMNMWHHRGHLQTRPGVRYVGESMPGLKYTGYDVILADGDKCVPCSVWYRQRNNENSGVTLEVYCIDGDGNFAFDGECMSYNFKEINNVWFAPFQRGALQFLYAYVYEGINTYEITVLAFSFYNFDFAQSVAKLSDEAFENAAPTVIVNNDFGNAARIRGQTFEGYNLINGKYKVMCTTNDDSVYVYMPHKQVSGTNIKIDFYTTLFGQKTLTLTEEITTDADTGEETKTGVWKASLETKGTPSTGGLIDATIYATFSNTSDTTGAYPLMLWYCYGSDTTKNPVGNGSGSSNMTVYMTMDLSDLSSSWDTTFIAHANGSIWYGGDAGGLAGGSYLFCYLKDSLGQSLLHWSDINSPLYFPEGNKAYIGMNNDGISHIAKMSNILVIFKKSSIYYMSYSSGENVTVDQLINGEVTDVTAYSAVFPIVCIHDKIGCDLPNTVQLCRNRLVWANSNGKVYEIVTHAYTSERNVYEISDNIENQLKTDEYLNSYNYDELQAYAADWNGFYVLSFGSKDIYLMNYNNYGFTNIYSYSKTDDAQNRMEWYKWTLPDKVKTLNNLDGELILCIEDNAGHRNIAVMDEELYQDIISETDKQDISCYFTTKLFDFGYPEIYKSMEQLYFGAGSERDGEITMSFITHRGETAERKITLEAKDRNSPDYIKEYRQLPMQRRVRTFGLKFSSAGQFAFNGYSIKWKQLGGIR